MSVDLIPISSFVVVPVPGNEDSKVSIKKFVESKNLSFAKGAGFYQLSKPETIQLNKDILVQRLSDPKNLIKGKTVREVLKIDELTGKNGKFMVDDAILKEFKIFVQSTSYNRNLIGGTTFLYKKEGIDFSSSEVVDEEAPTAKRPRRGTSAAKKVSSPPTTTKKSSPSTAARVPSPHTGIYNFRK